MLHHPFQLRGFVLSKYLVNKWATQTASKQILCTCTNAWMLARYDPSLKPTKDYWAKPIGLTVVEERRKKEAKRNEFRWTYIWRHCWVGESDIVCLTNQEDEEVWSHRNGRNYTAVVVCYIFSNNSERWLNCFRYLNHLTSIISAISPMQSAGWVERSKTQRGDKAPDRGRHESPVIVILGWRRLVRL